MKVQAVINKNTMLAILFNKYFKSRESI